MTKKEFNNTQEIFKITSCVKYTKGCYRIKWIRRGWMGENKRWFEGQTMGDAIENCYNRLIENSRHYPPKDEE